ncbi:MAG TPA: PHB depolymerase family esterase [Polyangiaceae bacterium]|jgi:polyhydroxybutyrate depolymerase|nr:PHB depolymerase family esterase [Polyangiaceae bacterium]
MTARWALPLLLLGSLLACGGSAPGDAPYEVATVMGRTYDVKVPAGYDGSRPMPLVVAIHGYMSDAVTMESYFGLDPVADAQGFFVAYPQGTVDQAGHRFFTATDACCDFYDTGVDDVAFIGALLDQMEAKYAIDPARVFAVGHSNGGFLSHRLACDLSPRLAAVVSLEGATWMDPSRCTPTQPVTVLEVHGTADAVIPPGGGDVVDGYPDRVFPSVGQTVSTWATLEGCTGPMVPGEDPGPIDAEATGTVVTTCHGRASDVGLWMIQGGMHSPELTAAWPEALYAFLSAHPKTSRDVTIARE